MALGTCWQSGGEAGKLFSELNERIRDVRQGPDGLLYLLTDSANGRVIRLQSVSDDNR